jgi:hypothetical protein
MYSSPLVTSSLLGPNILLSRLCSNTLSLHFSLNERDQVSQPYKTTGKIAILYIFVFLDSKLEDKRFCTEVQQALPDFSLFLIKCSIGVYDVKHPVPFTSATGCS